MAGKTRKVSTMLEPEIEDAVKALADKKGISASTHIRSLILEDLKWQGMLPDSIVMNLLKAR